MPIFTGGACPGDYGNHTPLKASIYHVNIIVLSLLKATLAREITVHVDAIVMLMKRVTYKGAACTAR